jgi:hypothetical protein
VGGSTLTLIKGTLKLMTRAKLKLATFLGASVLLTAGITTVAVQQANKNDQKSKLPPEAIAQLEKQKAAMRYIYFEFTQRNSGTLTNYNYNFAPSFSAYFEGSHFYRQYHDEVAFDGRTIWCRQNNRVIKSSMADDIGVTRHFLRWEWPYLDAAGVYAPTFIPELEHFSALEPLVLRCLERADSAKVEMVGENLRVTLEVEDISLVNMRQIDLGDYQRYEQRLPNTADFVAAQIENLKRMRKMKPTRTISFLLDSQHGYAVAEREEWTAAGEQIVRVVSDNWQFYKDAGIWLPGRCVASYYTRPRSIIDFSKEPVHFATNELKLVEFGKKSISFDFDQSKPNRRIFDRSAPQGP